MRAVAEHVRSALPVEDVLKGVMSSNRFSGEFQIGRNWREAVGWGGFHLLFSFFSDRYCFFVFFWGGDVVSGGS